MHVSQAAAGFDLFKALLLYSPAAFCFCKYLAAAVSALTSVNNASPLQSAAPWAKG
jgi:hypothetical protein